MDISAYGVCPISMLPSNPVPYSASKFVSWQIHGYNGLTDCGLTDKVSFCHTVQGSLSNLGRYGGAKMLYEVPGCRKHPASQGRSVAADRRCTVPLGIAGPTGRRILSLGREDISS